MRVIAGRYRSRPIVAPRGSATRPTSDRLRETLFNILAPRIEGSRFADLYAGTGAVGIEALSRGAAEVWFAEKAAPAIGAIRGNLRTLGIGGGIHVGEKGVWALLTGLLRSSAQVDLVFLDPPYEDLAAYGSTLQWLGEEGTSVLAAGAMVIAEHASRTELGETYGRLRQTRRLKQGDAALSFYALEEGAEEPAGEAGA